jgi:NADPH2:quinone reductase
MRAIVCEELGGVDKLVLRDMPTPVPGTGDVLIGMRTAALNFPDLLTIAGTYQHKQVPPFIPGLEGAGRVTAVGAGVDTAMIGRAVMVGVRGTFSEAVRAPIRSVSAMPAGWSWVEAGAYQVIAKTAYHALVQKARLQAGETLLVNGASGGTGHMAVKLGKALGARVIATGGNAAKFELVRRLGADAVVAVTGDDVAARIKSANGGRGVDVVFDPVGGSIFDASLKACAYGARIAIVGFASGDHNILRTNYALIKGLSIIGVRAGEAARVDPRVQADYETDLPALAAAHDLRPHIGATYPIEQAAEALAHLAARGAVGKIVLAIAGNAAEVPV